MFTAPRFVVVDDKEHHLKAIVETFQQLGSPCFGIRYDPAQELDKEHFRGVRGLFLDLHLIEGAAGTDNRRHYAQIAQILEDSISPVGGPFVLVIWTEHPQLADELKAYLDQNLDPEKPHARPLSVLSIAKEQFINVESGDIRPAAALKEAVEQAVSANPQLAALIGWEKDVLAAAGATLSSLLSLVSAEERTIQAYPGALDAMLSRLAREAVGKANVAADPRAAITSVLGPILADRIANQELREETRALWGRAITRHADKDLPPSTAAEAGLVNRMLHLAVPPSETIRPTDWGAVVDFPQAGWTDEELKRSFGASRAELLGEEFKISKGDRSSCRTTLVRIGAACDHAQSRRGPLTYLLGLEVPIGVERIKDTSGTMRPPASEWRSPVFTLDGIEPFNLLVNSRFVLSLPSEFCQDWTVRYRMREQLVMHLISHANTYVSRPGIVQLPIS